MTPDAPAPPASVSKAKARGLYREMSMAQLVDLLRAYVLDWREGKGSPEFVTSRLLLLTDELSARIGYGDRALSTKWIHGERKP